MEPTKFGEDRNKSKKRNINLSKIYNIFFFILGFLVAIGIIYSASFTGVDNISSNETEDPRERELMSNEKLDDMDKSTVLITSGGEQGTGFFYTKKGYIITNEHVIKAPKETDVEFNGLSVSAEFIGSSEETDVAILKIDPKHSKDRNLTLADDLPIKNTPVMTIGASNGLPNTVSKGIITNSNRLLNIKQFVVPNSLQFNAEVFKGNSGGPIIDRRTGEVLGIVRSKKTDGINFGINSLVIKKVFNDIVHGDGYKHSALYLRTGELTEEKLNEYNMEKPQGVYIDFVTSDAEPVNPLSFPPESILVGVNDTKITSKNELAKYLLFNTEPGNIVDLQLIDSDGNKKTHKIKIKEAK